MKQVFIVAAMVLGLHRVVPNRVEVQKNVALAANRQKGKS